MSECLFCKIVEGTVPARLLHRDADCVAFEDIHPQAPVHVLVVPTRHVASLDALGDEDAGLAGRLVATAARIARDRGVADGWRLVANCGADAGQSVFHLHLHVLGGRGFSWPPG